MYPSREGITAGGSLHDTQSGNRAGVLISLSESGPPGHTEGGFSLLSLSSLETPSQTRPEMSLLGDPKSSQVDDDTKLWTSEVAKEVPCILANTNPRE